MTMKLGSLFDGSGGFPLAGSLCGIEPVWASEVEPYPIAVTKERFDGRADSPLLQIARRNFPELRLYSVHLGNVCELHGGEIEPVDIIAFGSPCQGLSQAGLREGLKDERSGLFMEAVRIIKEMRKATNGMYPTFALWENVPGAFSSNEGEDFRIVCEELIKIVEPSAVMPPVPQIGWAYADSYVGDGWSLAYRVFDAQYWGVPQRRRRIHLVLDLRGERAREILFEREGVRGYSAQSGETRQGIAGDAERGSGADDRAGSDNCLNPWDYQSRRIFTPDGIFPTLQSRERSGQNQQAVVVPFDGINGETAGEHRKEQYLFENHSQDTRYKGPLGISPMLPAQLGTGGNNTPFVVEQTPFCKSARPKFKGDAPTYIPCKVTNTINTFDVGESRANELVVESIPIHDQATRFAGKRGDKSDGKGNGLGVGQEGDPMNTLTGGDRHAVAYCTDEGESRANELVVETQPTYCLQGSMIGRTDKNGPQGDGVNEDVSFTCNTTDRHAVAYRTDVGFFNSLENQSPTLLARSYKDPHLVTYPDDKVRYIVRRLTPTECARLQGFADQWGHIEPKEAFTDEEYRFWLEVRNTHAAINGKKVQEYTKPQMLTWYNKLHTDSAEYKMWGNGIALPPALYVMQGIANALYHAMVRANLPEHCLSKPNRTEF